jgi:type IV fimbrial biogenesis protein FimT
MDALERMQPKASTWMKPRVKSGGYSFIELLVAVSLVSIISLVALPSFREAHSAVALDSLSSDLRSILRLGRDEALTTGNVMVLCPSQTGRDCSAGAWNEGWLLFADSNNDSTGAVGSVDPDDPILRAATNRHRRLDVSVSEAPPQIRFDARGATAPAVLILCGLRIADGGAVPNRQTLAVGRTGLIAIDEESGLCE